MDHFNNEEFNFLFGKTEYISLFKDDQPEQSLSEDFPEVLDFKHFCYDLDFGGYELHRFDNDVPEIKPCDLEENQRLKEVDEASQFADIDFEVVQSSTLFQSKIQKEEDLVQHTMSEKLKETKRANLAPQSLAERRDVVNRTILR
jgi:hypothetical protein